MLKGMVTVRIQEVAREKGITTAYQLQKATGAQPTVAAKWFKNDLKSIGIETLDLLCKTLDCTPNDLLYYERERH